MQLKKYQKETLETLRQFLQDARIAGPKSAFDRLLEDPEHKARLGAYAEPYQPLKGLPNVPHVCLRLPTGGGKTILGAYSVSLAKDAWIEKDYPLVLWLVPSTTIKTQTAEALKNTRHPYRKVLDDDFEGRVRIFDIADFTQIRPHDISQNLCIVVGTIQSLRVTNTEGRKVYAHNENLEPHFSSISVTDGMELAENGPQKGQAKHSFANLLHHHRPLMIVDEAHNAVTGLTREVQQRVNPCAVIEFTATPKIHNNTLYNVTAQELKREEMIKLPIHLTEHDTWQNAVNGAVNSRAVLEKHAEADPAHIRPIVLFQAQHRGQEVTVEVLRNHLIEVEQIPEERIAVATGDQRELDGIDLFDPQCPIEYIITMEALKEGWDCSFAYVFCSVANIQSATDVEQLLGRVLRMPYAKKREANELNKAYAHISELSFQQAAIVLVDKLIAMGFEEEEAWQSIESSQGDLGLGAGLFGQTPKSLPTFKHEFAASPEVIKTLKQNEGEGVEVHETGDGRIKISVTGSMSDSLKETLAKAIPKAERPAFHEAAKKHQTVVRESLSPAQRGERFTVPRLMAHIQGELEFADTDGFMEFHDWTILDHPARLDESQFNIRVSSRNFEIDLDGNHISYHLSGEDEQLALDIPVEGWTPENLALWLDRQVRQPDIGQSALVKWLRDLVSHLTSPRELHISALMRCKFILARKVREMIDGFRTAEREKVYQQFLFEPDAKVELSFENGFEFKEGIFQGQKRYRGRYQFQKYFLGPDNVQAFDGKETGEEFQCAQYIDSLSEVKYWIRNVARHPNAFWLPTASGKFYPDFVAKLNDDRLLVVEYKGAHLSDSSDTHEKETVGRLWEKSSGGKGLFLIATINDEEGKDTREQLKEKVTAN